MSGPRTWSTSRFGMVSYEGQALSTRHGHVIYLEDLLNRSIEKGRAR